MSFTLDSEDLPSWYKWKKWFLWIMAAVQNAQNHGDESGTFDLILLMRDIYIDSKLNPLTKFTSSSRSIMFKDIFFFLSGFSSQTLTIHRTAGKGRGPSFILFNFKSFVPTTISQGENLITNPYDLANIFNNYLFCCWYW